MNSKKERNKKRKLRRELDKLINQWAPDSRSLVPDPQYNTDASILTKLDHLIENGWDRVDKLITWYEDVLKTDPRIERTHPRGKVYEAGVICCKSLNARWDVFYTEAKTRRILKRDQIDVMDSYIEKEKEDYRIRMGLSEQKV